MHPFRGRALGVLSLLQFLIAVDVTVVNVALPSIGAELGAGTASLTWVVTGYALAGGGLLLLGGRICDLFGRRRMFLLGTALFGLSSLLAGAATSLPLLLVARLGQGAGEALASPAAMSLIALLFPEPKERARALGIWGGISASGLVGGVLLSGVLTELLHWRWIFLVNVPLVAAVLIATPLCVRPDAAERTARWRHLDLPGAALLTCGPLALVYGVLHAAEHPWTSTGVLLPLAGGALALAAFVAVEARTAQPLVPLRFFAHRTRTVANAATVLLSAALSTTFFLATLYMQHVLGMGPLAAGLAYLPFCAALLGVIAVVSRIIGALGLTATALLGLVCAGAGCAWLARLPEKGSLWTDVIPGMVAVAIGMGLGLIALQNAALHGVTEDDAGIASGVQRSVDQIGSALGLAVLVGAAQSAGAGAAGAGVADSGVEVEGYRTAFRYAVAGVLAAVALLALWGREPGREPKSTR
ncbi:MFS transporter [Streptomyces sp. NPDC048172]|uniref:MFS transporter n=1 Tax=Streptomyces sp. NPDC048172 TaxID=3365505 RepID=UPI003715D2FD